MVPCNYHNSDIFKLVRVLKEASLAEETNAEVKGDVVNASADRYNHFIFKRDAQLIESLSFYSSQGRVTSFPDHNEGLMDRLLKEVESLASLEVGIQACHFSRASNNKFTLRWKRSTSFTWPRVGATLPRA